MPYYPPPSSGSGGSGTTDPAVLAETIRDTVDSHIVAGSNIVLAPDDAGNKLVITSLGGSAPSANDLRVVKVTQAEYDALAPTEVFTNNFPDGSVESGLPAGWTSWGLTVSRSTEWAEHGSYSVKVVPSGSIGPHFTPSPITGMNFGMVAGQKYTAMATIRVPQVFTGTPDSNSLRLRAAANNGTTTTWFDSNVGQNNVGSYQLRVTFTLPADTTSAFFRVYHGYPTAGQAMYIDQFALIPGEYTGPWYPTNQTGGSGGAGYAPFTLYAIV